MNEPTFGAPLSSANHASSSNTAQICCMTCANTQILELCAS